jgi:cellulose synthase (UDP-forming)
MKIERQSRWHYAYYAVFGIGTLFLLLYYLSNTIVHMTTTHQFPVNSIERFPLTMVIFPAEVFSMLFALYFIYCLYNDHRQVPRKELENKKSASVAVLLPVYHEPEEIVERTILAATQMEWEGKIKIYLLDDSTKAEEKKAMKRIAKKYKADYIEREGNEGFKAGNINNAIKNHVTEDYFIIFDSDMAPEKNFLTATMDHFSDDKVGFIQTPQYFINDDTPLERASKIGTNIFFQSQCACKAKDGALPFCGTNVIVRTRAFREVGGFKYYSSTEDIDLGLRMNHKGYYGVYVPEVLARGYAPQDYKAYASQQYRWSNGNLAILRENFRNILAGKYTIMHMIHTLFTLGWWLIGIVTLIYILVPLISLYTKMGTHHTWLPNFMLVILYLNVFIGIGMIYVALQGRIRGERVTLKDAYLQYALITNSAFIFARSAISAVIGRYVGFVRTNKTKAKTSYWLIAPNLVLGAVLYASSIYALHLAMRASVQEQIRTYLPISIWLLFYATVLISSIIFIESEKKISRLESERKYRSLVQSNAVVEE